MKYTDYVKNTADEIIKAINAGVAPWQKPWSGGSSFLPMNASTNSHYSGMNTIRLMMSACIQGFSDSRWVTYKQAIDMGGRVCKGQKSTQGVYWAFKDKKDEVTDELLEVKAIPCIFSVFNVEQCEGLELPKIEKKEFHPIESAERLLKRSGVTINHVAGNKAFYSLLTDEITLPMREQFNSESDYYDTALHELGHWSGHETRLNRELLKSYALSIESRAREELRAEIASMMLSMSIGLPHNTDKHASYIDSWVKAIQNDPKEIFKAANDAEKIKNFILAL